MHFHVGAFEFLKFVLMLIVAGFVLRTIQVAWPNNKFSHALSFVY